MLFVVLMVPVLVLRPFLSSFLTAFGLVAAFGVVGYLSDKPTQLTVSDDGVEYLAGGRDRHFLAWSEIGSIVPRRFRGWPAEDALVVRDHADRPLLVAGVSMFHHADLVEVVRFARQYVEVTEPVRLSAFTGRAHGQRRPDLVPERTSERFLVSSVGGFLLAGIVGFTIITLVGR